MDAQLKSRIETLVASSPVFIFMKGSKLMPQCGFSNNVVQIFHSLGFPKPLTCSPTWRFVRASGFSNWPTIPQVYLNGEFLGGSDIMIEMYNSGELRETVTVALAS